MSTAHAIALSRFLLFDHDTERSFSARWRNAKTNARPRTSDYSTASTRRVITFSLHRERQLHPPLILIKVDRQFVSIRIIDHDQQR